MSMPAERRAAASPSASCRRRHPSRPPSTVSRGRHVVDGRFTLDAGETLCVAGESGSGKSVTALSLMGLLPKPGGRITGGTALFQGRDLFDALRAEMRDVRGDDIAMIFQEPMTSLNPVLTIGTQMTEGLRRHKGLGARRPRSAPSPCWTPCAFPKRGGGCSSTRTSCPAACASA